MYKRRSIVLAYFVPLCLVAQAPLPKKAPPPKPVTGLKAVSVALDLKTQDETIQLQNVSDKTAVAYMLRIVEFDAQGKEIGDANFSQVGFDWAGPEPNPSASNFILPGRITSFVPGKASPDAVSVEASVTAVIYDDGTFEGLAQGFFLTRAAHGREAREAAAKEPPGEKKSQLERRAEWYEAHRPKEAK